MAGRTRPTSGYGNALRFFNLSSGQLTIDTCPITAAPKRRAPRISLPSIRSSDSDSCSMTMFVRRCARVSNGYGRLFRSASMPGCCCRIICIACGHCPRATPISPRAGALSRPWSRSVAVPGSRNPGCYPCVAQQRGRARYGSSVSGSIRFVTTWILPVTWITFTGIP